ncbi:LysR substrate-binding domain-containing protein [Psychromonas sp.]|nr:LysR substrate-binding domain-containing protein [Psychromonas sp.]
MKVKMPHFQNLYSFYQSAELGSFKLAAESMFISSAAISQQIRQLEEQLGVKLFERQHRKVVLTQEGQILHRYAQQGFSAFQEGVRQISLDNTPNSIALSTLPSFAQHWLVPRLGDFCKQYPEFTFLMMPKNSLVDFAKEQVDLCIRFGPGNYPDIHSEFLMSDHLYPVCHPLYLKEHNIKSLNDIQNARLIEDARPDMDWAHWLKIAGIITDKMTPSLQYQGAHMVIEGALAVQGVALVRHSLAWKYIQQGLLVKIGNIEICSSYSYWLCGPEAYFNREKVRYFAEWIKTETEQFWNESVQAKASNTIILKDQEVVSNISLS